MPSSTVENYLKRIYVHQQRHGDALVPMGALATAMDVTPGTATAMVKTLAEAKLLEYEPRGGVRLTPEGVRLALGVLRRHRLIELFLVQVLKLDWSEVHPEAEELEHALSDKVLERIDDLLGHPDTDPHGDPIPAADGSPRKLELRSLAECTASEPVRIARVLDQEADFLQFVDRHGLTPGTTIVIEQRSASADAVTLRPLDGEPVTMGTSAAAKILVAAAKPQNA